MRLALKQYVTKVAQTPCMKTTIKLFPAKEKHINTERRDKLVKFLSGGKKVKEELKKQDPETYAYFDMIWKVRNSNMDNTLPSNYVFLLKCCGSVSTPTV